MIFVFQSLHIKYWGTEKSQFEKIMQDFGLLEVKGLSLLTSSTRYANRSAFMSKIALI